VDKTTVIFDCPLPAWVVGPAAGALLVAVMVFARRDVAHLGRMVRSIILILVAAAGSMLAGLMLAPKLIRVWPDPQKPRCSVLADGSRSMLLADTYTGEEERWLKKHVKPEDGDGEPEKFSREKIVRKLLDRGEADWLAALRKDFDVSGWRFASELQGLALTPDAPHFKVNEEGYSTALGQAMELAAGGSGGSRPRALVLISDGAWNAGPDPSEVARVLGRLAIPVYAIGVGNPSPPRDAAVLSLNAPKSVLLGDEVALTAKVAATGMGSRRVPVQLLSSGELIEEKHVLTLPLGRPITVNFSFTPSAPCRQHLTVRIPKQQDEQDKSNNQASALVEVVERKLNVLLIDAEPRWEFRFIRNVLERDRTVTLTIHLTRPGIGPIKGPGYVQSLPTKRKDLAAYDLIILGDVPRKSLPDDFLKELAEMIKLRSGGLIVIAGRRGHYRHLAGTPLHEILPVRMEGHGGGSRAGTPFKPRLTRTGVTHLITRLASDPEENELEWAGLPEMTWAADVSEVVPGARALLVHPERVAGGGSLPLMAVHRVGGGKVMFCGVEETWRWRKVVGDKYHYKFWAQALRWMVKQPFADGDPRARLSLGRTECSVGESVDIEAYCLGPDGFPLDGVQVWLNVADDGRAQQLVMEASPGGWGIYRTTFTPELPGKYKMQPIVSAYGDEPLSSSASLDVTRADLEKNFLAQDRNMLQSIAQASGGLYLRINEVDKLTAALTAKVKKRYLTAEYSPCRHWAYYTTVALLLGTAWSIRKRSGLA